MKKLIVLLIGLILIAGAASMANAATYGSVALSVSVSGDLSVSITPVTYNFGALAPNTKTVSTAITVTNNSVGYVETYCLKASGGGAWTIGAAQGANVYTLAAAFHGATAPLATAFGAEDLLADSAGNGPACTTTIFSIDGTVTGVNVGPGIAKSLYFCLGMPTTSTTTGPLTITATITASL